MIFDANFIELINILNKKKAKYVLVGGMAVIIHGVNRTTKDMDLFYSGDLENCRLVLESINEFGFRYLNLTIDDLLDKSGYLQLGNEPVRIDLFCDLPGIDFGTVYQKSVSYKEDDFEVMVIHINHLIRNKEEVGRFQDKWDVSKLKKLIKKK